MTINTWNTKESLNGLNLEQLTKKLNTNPIKFYVERKKKYWHFLNDQERKILKSQHKLFLYNTIKSWFRTELKKVTDKDYDISWMIKYLSNQIRPSNEIEDPVYSDSNSKLIHKFYNELYEEKNKLPNFMNNIWRKCSDLLKSLKSKS